MKSDENPMIICLRPGEGRQGVFSDYGIRQMQAFKKQIETTIQTEYEESRVGRLLISFSYNNLALKSVQGMRNSDDCCLIKDWPFSCRDEIIEHENPDAIFMDVLMETSRSNNPVAIIVAHGSMPAVLAEIAYKRVSGRTVLLENTNPGTGFCVTPRTKKIMRFSLEGSTDITPA